MSKTKIEWTESSWNPVTGCTKISEGCKNCYAERMSLRLKAMKQPIYSDGFNVRTHIDLLEKPLKWKKPQMIFVNSMSDLFHEDVPTEFIIEVFNIMNTADRHIFQVLTKRSERLLELNDKLIWSKNIWMGVSVENEKNLNRIENLRMTNAAVKFISIEPLIGPIENIDLHNIDWVIVGGESGPKARIMKKEWVLRIKDICLANGVPFFFKQWGGFNKKSAGRLLEGKTWDQIPNHITI